MKLTSYTNFALRSLQLAALKAPDLIRVDDVPHERPHPETVQQRFLLNEGAPSVHDPDQAGQLHFAKRAPDGAGMDIIGGRKLFRRRQGAGVV